MFPKERATRGLMRAVRIDSQGASGGKEAGCREEGATEVEDRSRDPRPHNGEAGCFLGIGKPFPGD